MIADADSAVGGPRQSVQADDNDPNFADENGRHDYRAAIQMSEAARDCAIAFWFTGGDAYASCAVEILHHWTLDGDTYMKPTVDIEKNSTTIEQQITIPAFMYAASFVRGHSAWEAYDGSEPWENGSASDAEAAFQEWVRDRHRTFESTRPSFCEYNNKWAWRITDRAATGAYLQNDTYVKQAREMYRTQRATTCPDGSTRLRPWNDFRNGDGPHAYGNSAEPDKNAYFNHELSRSTAFGYTAYNLKAFALAATVFDAYDGSDLWGFNAPETTTVAPRYTRGSTGSRSMSKTP
ncbi:MAG: alginate lyase family protein, partial [Bradymonadaceae bacterium]